MRRNYHWLPKTWDDRNKNPKSNEQTSYQGDRGMKENESNNSDFLEIKLKEKFVKEVRSILIVVLIELLMIIALICIYHKKPIEQSDNAIIRPYTDILSELEDEPEDISKEKYQEKIPSVIQKDIDKMLKMGDSAYIVYYNDAGDKIIIEPSKKEGETYRIRFRTKIDLSVLTSEDVSANISFYKNEDTLVIYGGESWNRMIHRFYMSKTDIDIDFLDNNLVDLYGAEESVDRTWCFNSYCTMIKKGTKFSMYRFGKQLCTKEFDGGKIKSLDYYYLLTTTKECYSVYYSMEEDNPWIKFVKVIENVDEILEDERISVSDVNGNCMEFPIFRIGNKKYAQIPDPEAERAYGQNYGGDHRNEGNVELDFVPKLIEVSAINSSKVELKYEYAGSIRDSYEWRLLYYFNVDGRECFMRRRINGLDCEISTLIPEKKLDMFKEKVISPDEVEEYIHQLRLLYDEYTDNKF